MELYTIGHSTHSKDIFLKMLQDVGVEVLADVRAFPGSHKFPQFSKDHMPDWLENEGISYFHMSKLGGRRNDSGDVSPKLNGAWNNQSFHNYADYTLSNNFKEGIDELKEIAFAKLTVYCCSEQHPARCHRLLISNWLKANGVNVKHIIDRSDGKIEVVDHVLGKWGAMPIIEEDGTVVYPVKNE
ncbi:DNA repair protein [Virgibacillus profundi]|uniref:DNA repair protein n=1 Tax=Virgibacillus profundi TaxID=2024555 RepID=A0A2A2I924_9BACI|nr:DUF488 domain-containing protein [Virgibacillus profundi]PAV28219.1 DNA repair protein [Virgibacillus profundi]PXY52523.1 DUF488 domain-containing protein [Virgibacillus profundi]